MTDEKQDSPRAISRRPTTLGVAWATIAVFIILSLGLVGAAYIGAQSMARDAATRASSEADEEIIPLPVFEPTEGVIEGWTKRAADVAAEAVRSELDTTLSRVFAPVHDAVPAYADFHYSVLGEYIELTEAATQSVSSSMQEQLFAGFDARLAPALEELGGLYAQTFNREIDAQLEADRTAFDQRAIVGDVTRAIVDDAVARASAGLPADVLAAGAGAVGAKAAATALGKALMKSLTKIAAKSAVKPLGIGGTAAVGAGTGSFLGPPGAIAGGVIGAGIGWIAMDYAVVKIDEFISRDDFEADLHALIDAEEAALRDRIEKALAARANGLAGGTIEEVRGDQDAARP